MIVEVLTKLKIKKILNSISPEILATRTSLRMRRSNKKKFWNTQCDIFKTLYADENAHVISGPFCGMRYINEVVWGPIEPKWFGTYEQELHPIIVRIIDEKYDTIIDVGSAEGYYSVGLAIFMPQSSVHSFEIDPLSRFQQARLAKLNNVTNIRLYRYCRHQDIDRISAGRTLLICDIEGFEHELLEPKKSASLRYVDLLVELHGTETVSMVEMESEIKSRFKDSHKISRIVAEPRVSPAHAALNVFPYVYSDLIDEHRISGQVWLWMQALDAISTAEHPGDAERSR